LFGSFRNISFEQDIYLCTIDNTRNVLEKNGGSTSVAVMSVTCPFKLNTVRRNSFMF
jgi:hypothetical protein